MDTFGISLDKKIRQAIRQGNGTCTSIASHADARLEDVYRELQRMIFDGEIQKGKSGALTIYEFAAKGNPLNTPETKEKILNAIRAGFKSLPGIKRHARFERSDDLTEALEELQHDSVIRKFTNSELSAYFECPEKPRCFWQETDGTVGAEMEEILDEPDEDPEEEEETEVEETMSPKPAFAAPVVKKQRGRKKTVEIDADRLRKLAAEGLQQKDIAKQMGVQYGTFVNAISREPEFKEAYRSGRQSYLDNNPEAKSFNHKINWTPELLEDLAARFGFCDPAGKHLGVSKESIRGQIKNHLELAAAWKRGLAKFNKPQKNKKGEN